MAAWNNVLFEVFVLIAISKTNMHLVGSLQKGKASGGKKSRQGVTPSPSSKSHPPETKQVRTSQCTQWAWFGVKVHMVGVAMGHSTHSGWVGS